MKSALALHVSESKIQSEVIRYAKSKGWKVVRFLTKSYPDRMFLKKPSKMFMIEFKASGKSPTKLQSRTISKLKSCGFSVYVVDDIEDGKRIVDIHSTKSK